MCNNHSIISLIIMSLVLSTGVIQAQTGFEIRINTPQVEDKYINICCDELGYLYCTYYKKPASVNTNNLSQSYLYRISQDGDTISLDYTLIDTLLMLPDIFKDSEGDILIGGCGWKYDTIQGATGKFQYFIKLNSDLEILWKRKFKLESESSSTISRALFENYEGNYILAATTLTEPSPHTEMLYIFEFSVEGDSLYYKLMDQDHTGLIRCITEKNNSTNLYLHIEQGPPPPNGNLSQCKRLEVSDEFNPVSFDNYPSWAYTGPFYTMNYPGNKVLSFGTYWELIPRERDRNYYLNARIMDSSLNIVSQTSLTDPERKAYAAWARGLDYRNEERIYVVGTDNVETSLSYPSLTDYIYVACLDENLDIIHDEYLESENDFFLINSMCATTDGGVAIAGGVYDLTYQNYKYDGYILKLDSLQFVGIKDTEIAPNNETISIFPNPARENLNIISSCTPYVFEILDMTGRRMLYEFYEYSKNQINVKDFPSGIYLWHAEFGSYYEYGVLIKL